VGAFLGDFVLRVLEAHGDAAHWARKQQTETAYAALGGRVLFCGDSAGAIYPSLGQGANLSLEDACVVAAAFRRGLRDEQRRDAARLDAAALAEHVAAVRGSRRDFVRDMSRAHAEHVSSGDLDAEAAAWNDGPDGEWGSRLGRLWRGWPRAATSELPPLRARTATRANFAAFGELVAESEDGELYDATAGGIDASLDLSQGPPRLYLMRLDGPRELSVSMITRHQRVTQCLGALGEEKDFYLVVHQPGDEPSVGGLNAFRVPPRHFVKLHAGTWHAGPLWTRDEHRTFVNLELADTVCCRPPSGPPAPTQPLSLALLPPSPPRAAMCCEQ